MTETVDQAQAQPPRALAGITGDATSLSLASTSHSGGSRGGRLPSRPRRTPASSHISIGASYTTSVDITRGLPCGHSSRAAVSIDAECSMNHACGPSTTQAVTPPSCMTPTATTSKPLGEHHPRQRGDGQGRPRVAGQDEQRPPGEEGRNRQGDLHPVVARPAVEQAGRPYLPRQGMKAGRRRIGRSGPPACS